MSNGNNGNNGNNNIKAPEEISAELFRRAMKAFNDEYDSHPINEKAEQAFLKAQADRQEHLESMFSEVDFDMPVGTLVRIDLGGEKSQTRKDWMLGLGRPDGLEEGECLLYTGWFRRDVLATSEVSKTILEPPKIDIKEMTVNESGSVGTAKFDFDIKPAKYSIDEKVNEDLSSAFSTRIQVWLRGGKEETWTGIIPSRYYVTVAKGSGKSCTEPLFVQEHGLKFNKELISKVINRNRVTQYEDAPPALRQIMDETGAKTVAEAKDIQEALRRAHEQKLKKSNFRYDPTQGKYVSVTQVEVLPETEEARKAREKLRKALREKYEEEYDKATQEAKERHEKAQRGELAKVLKDP